jgi:hypothetical protein
VGAVAFALVAFVAASAGRGAATFVAAMATGAASWGGRASALITMHPSAGPRTGPQARPRAPPHLRGVDHGPLAGHAGGVDGQHRAVAEAHLRPGAARRAHGHHHG